MHDAVEMRMHAIVERRARRELVMMISIMDQRDLKQKCNGGSWNYGNRKIIL